MTTPRTETAIAAALSRAGMNTAETRLRSLALDALKKHHRNIDRALPTLVAAVENDPDLIRQALLEKLRHVDAETVVGHAACDTHTRLAGDRHPPPDTQNSGASPDRNGVDQASHDIHTPIVHSVREPSAEQTAADIKVRSLSALTVFDRTLTHTGRRWGNIYYRELDSMTDDGELARAVKVHIGSLRGDDRHKTVRELMTPREFYAVLRKCGRSGNAA